VWEFARGREIVEEKFMCPSVGPTYICSGRRKIEESEPTKVRALVDSLLEWIF
jgi:hypothetical protein